MGRRARTMTLDTLPRDYRGIESSGKSFRRELERAVEAKHEEISIFAESLIDAASRHQVALKVLARKFRESGEKMSAEAAAELQRQMAVAAGKRTKIIERLGLDDLSGKKNGLAQMFGSRD
ncbi:hypothetical protein Pan216_37140 [Planctomycetes bacterium Pan216]|uniref:Uncharacterized protein n=1 Tax=Kolteria novifilia TaxID=2527975 RepID=A0A518B7A8_9BACT|nr:hypothetical protein Pan216_37140 [Planctomycetes bacterium Pan216]